MNDIRLPESPGDIGAMVGEVTGIGGGGAR